MSRRTTVGWSLIAAGVIALVLTYLPWDSFWWGLGLLLVGIAVLFVGTRGVPARRSEPR